MHTATHRWSAFGASLLVGCAAGSVWAQPATQPPLDAPPPSEAPPVQPLPPPPDPPPPPPAAMHVGPETTPQPSGPEPTPLGYYRDSRGRSMQTQFDMNRRLWLGGRWAPFWSERGTQTVGRGALEIGARSESVSDDGRWRGRFRLIEGEALLSPLEARGTVFRYDESRESDTPLLRLTTFWPGPRRHDLYLNVGFWGELLGVEMRPRGSEDETQLRFGGMGATWDLWHSRDLEDYLRLRVGTALDHRIGDAGEADPGGVAATPLARAELDSLLDRGGFHRITVEAGIETPIFLEPAVERRLRRRLSGSLGYELVFVAVNDQPITLRVSGTGGYRDDLARADLAGWEVGGGVGLRVNLWAPPPRPPPPPPEETRPVQAARAE